MSEAEKQSFSAPPTTSGEDGRYKRQVRNYLLNRSFQLRFTMIIVLISTVLTGGLSSFVMSKAREATRLLNVRAMDPTDTLAADLLREFQRSDRLLLYGLIAFGVCLVIVLLLYGIVLTHKVAGPLFKVGIYLDRIRDGRLTAVTPLRKGDQLHEFFDHFKQAHDALRLRTEADVALLDRAIAATSDASLKADLQASRASKAELLK